MYYMFCSYVFFCQMWMENNTEINMLINNNYNNNKYDWKIKWQSKKRGELIQIKKIYKI